MKILIITTGGTIDKSYIEEREKLVNQKSLLIKTLKKIRHSKKIEFNHFIALDSNEIKDTHRKKIVNIILANQAKFDGFIITHGTDTLIQTARYIKQELKNNNLVKPVILTGAMRPLSVKGSDGEQNFIESLFSFEFIKSGVHLVMHSQIYNPDKTQKNYKKMCFELTR